MDGISDTPGKILNNSSIFFKNQAKFCTNSSIIIKKLNLPDIPVTSIASKRLKINLFWTPKVVKNYPNDYHSQKNTEKGCNRAKLGYSQLLMFAITILHLHMLWLSPIWAWKWCQMNFYTPPAYVELSKWQSQPKNSLEN